MIGLGDTLPSVQRGFLGGSFDCSSLVQYATSPSCWQYSLDAWRQMNALAVAAGPIPAPAPPGGPQNITQETIPGAFTPDMAIATGVAQTGQNLQDYFGQAVQSIQNAANVQSGPGVWFWVALVVGGLFVFDLAKAPR